MITNYNEYVNSKLNEGILSSLKNLFGKLLKNVTDEIKKPIDDLTTKLNKAKDIKGVNTYLTEYLKVINVALIKTIDEAKSITGLTKVVQDNITAVYVSMDAAIKSQGGNAYSFEELFKDSSEPLQNLFDKSEKRFNKRIVKFAENLILIQGKPYGINKINIKSKADIEDTVVQDTIGQDKTDTTDTTDKTDKTDKINTDLKESMLNEALFKKDVKTDGADVVLEKKDKISLEQFNNTKNIVKKWFDEKLYKPIRNEMKAVSKDKPKEEASTTTKNTEGVQKMKTALQALKGDDTSIDKLADTISELSDPKQLATVRELLVKMGKGTKEDYGKF